MADAFEEQEWVRFGVAATLARQYTADERGFLDLLARMLEGALPQETEIIRKGGLFAKKTIRRIVVTLGENRYEVEDPGHGPMLASRTHIVRGIALKTEPMPIPEWLDELGAMLEERAKNSQAARDALARLVG